MFESKRRNQNSNDDWNRTKVGCSSGKRGHVRRKDHLHKMELCQSWFSGERCPYGSACNFAHDKSELRLKTYSERNKDASDFRTHPCFDQVSTGHWYVYIDMISKYFCVSTGCKFTYLTSLMYHTPLL